jgi:hypothetical protein
MLEREEIEKSLGSKNCSAMESGRSAVRSFEIYGGR